MEEVEQRMEQMPRDPIPMNINAIRIVARFLHFGRNDKHNKSDVP